MADRPIVTSKLETLRKKRFQELKKRKSFWPSFIINIALWLSLLAILFWVDPNTKGALELFLSIFFLSLLFTFSLLFGNTRRGALCAVAILFFSILLYLGVGTLLNLVLIIASAGMFEIYFTKRK